MCNLKKYYQLYFDGQFFNIKSTLKNCTLIFGLICCLQTANSQICPPNIDFESGNFDGWRCYTGTVSNQGGINVFALTEVAGPEIGRHTIIPAQDAYTDQFGGFLTRSPNGSGNCIRLGNEYGGGQAEAVSYEFTIPAGQDLYNLIYYYAVVFEDPNHEQFEQPRMEIEITNVTDGVKIDCASFSFIPFGTGLPGFFQSSYLLDSNAPVWCKDWSPVSINLNGNAGKTIRILFRTGDCTFRRHFGYAYIDVDSDCSGEFVGASFCPEDEEIMVSAPFGFQNYTWFNNDRSRVLGNGQTLTLSPPPATGTTVIVDLDPYAGFGCKQTLNARLVGNLVTDANAGRDTLSCNLAPVRIGGPQRNGLVYNWTPENGLSSTTIANPFATPLTSTQYILTVKSPGGGCESTDTVMVLASNLGSSLELLGKPEYCIGSGDSAVFQVTDAILIEWYRNNQLITGESNSRLVATQSGDYNAFLRDSLGCAAITRVQPINISSIPVAEFFLNNLAQCFVGHAFSPRNQSTNTTGSMQYRWSYESTILSNTAEPVIRFPAPGKYALQLKVFTNSVCADSTTSMVTVYPNPVPDFYAVAACVENPFTIENLTDNNIGSPIRYSWNLGNGQTSEERVPPVLNFTTTGNIPITLSVWSEQCPTPVQTLTKNLRVESPKPPMRYPTAFVLVDEPLMLEARPIGVTALWDPSNKLNNPTLFNPVFRASLDQQYTIRIATEGGCVTVDSLEVQIVSKSDIYIPNAFTPNGDGLNDYLKPVLMGIKELKYFRVFNRWGEVVFQSATDKPGWNGIHKGKQQASQTYVWMVEGIGIDGKTVTKKGSCLLIR